MLNALQYVIAWLTHGTGTCDKGQFYYNLLIKNDDRANIFLIDCYLFLIKIPTVCDYRLCCMQIHKCKTFL